MFHKMHLSSKCKLPVWQKFAFNEVIDWALNFWKKQLDIYFFKNILQTPLEDSLENCPRHDAMIKCLTKSRRLFFDTQQSTVLSNGSLYIDELGWSERGKYECLSYDGLGRFQSTFVEIQLVDDFRTSLYYLSLIYAVATAGGFLLLTLLFKMIHFLLFTWVFFQFF